MSKRVTVITAPSVEPISIAEVKTRLAIRDEIDNDDIESAIKSAREYAEQYMWRAIVTQTVEMAMDAFTTEIPLPLGKAQTITSIKYQDSTNTEQTLDSSVYSLDTYSDPGVIYLNASQSWPTTYAIRNAVIIRWTAGYGTADDVPENIKTAIYIAVGHWIRFQANAESGVGITRMPREFYDLLDPYRLIEI